jgi:hypothetical protein
MPITPGPLAGQSTGERNVSGPPASLLRSRLWRILFCIVAVELGLFLVVYPWTDYWNLNSLPSYVVAIIPNFDDLWDDQSFRGAVTALGLVNLWIAIRAGVGLTGKSS